MLPLIASAAIPLSSGLFVNCNIIGPRAPQLRMGTDGSAAHNLPTPRTAYHPTHTARTMPSSDSLPCPLQHKNALAAPAAAPHIPSPQFRTLRFLAAALLQSRIHATSSTILRDSSVYKPSRSSGPSSRLLPFRVDTRPQVDSSQRFGSSGNHSCTHSGHIPCENSLGARSR